MRGIRTFFNLHIPHSFSDLHLEGSNPLECLLVPLVFIDEVCVELLLQQASKVHGPAINFNFINCSKLQEI